MFSYYSKQERKYRGFHSYFYCGIGFILGILIHALFTWRFGMMHYIFFFVAVFEVIYALVQMYRYRSYAGCNYYDLQNAFLLKISQWICCNNVNGKD